MYRKRIAFAGLLVGLGALLTGCSEPTPTVVSGTITDKYIEDFTEYQLVMEETGTGTKHHFEVTREEWRAAVVGQPYSNQQETEIED